MSGRSLLLARVLWFAIALLLLTTFFASMPFRFEDLRTVCVEGKCAELALTLQEAEMLREAGLSLDLYAGFMIGSEIWVVLVHTLLAGLIFWRRSADRMGICVSAALVMIGTFATSGGVALLGVYPRLHLLYNVQVALGLISFALWALTSINPQRPAGLVLLSGLRRGVATPR